MSRPLERPLEGVFRDLGDQRRAYFVRGDDGRLAPSNAALTDLGRAIETDCPDYEGHEGLFFEVGRETGAFFGAFLHRTIRGQGAGGVRHWPYDTVGSFVSDGLRLSRGMGRKNALAGLWWGGGKGIIARVPGDRHLDPAFRAALYREFGRFISSLRGVYVTAEDVGTGPDDMARVFETTRFTTCIPPALGGSGNPSSSTALGVVCAVEAALEHLGAGPLAGKRIAMQGAGNVSRFMLDALLERGVAHVRVTDIDESACVRVRRQCPADRVEVRRTDPNDLTIFEAPCDVLVPNALGGVLNPETIPRLKTRLICGAANNQLLDEARDSADLARREITWVPDFLANRMGIVSCANEQYGRLDDDPSITRHLGRDYEHSVHATTLRVLARARDDRMAPLAAAAALADDLAQRPHPLFGHRTALICRELVASSWQDGQS